MNHLKQIAADPDSQRRYFLGGVALATPSLLGHRDVWETVGAAPRDLERLAESLPARARP